ncbi:hypothetical protein ACU639_26465 [Streptomyces cynarae]|uniref:hypothetical protein n=1 Tax=Streptomyces cynarae TaxID=2981134 RepID=UPI00406C937F
MASAVLSGSVDVKDAFHDPRCTEAIYQRLHEIRRAADGQTYAERQASRVRFGEWDARQQAELDRERAERDAPVTAPTGEGGRSGAEVRGTVP